MTKNSNTHSKIHPMAVVENKDKIHSSATIEAFAVVKKDVTIGPDVVIKSHCYIDGYTEIGEGTVIWPSASIGTKTQDKKYKGAKTFVKIGKHCEIREFTSVNSSTAEGSSVEIGDHCLIMAYCHVAHNCKVGNHVIMSNSATLAGHVEVQDYAIIGGMTPIHQFCKIGCYAMVGGMSRVTHDIPPYTIGAGIPYKLGGLNMVGLKRSGFSMETRKLLAQAFKLVYRSGLKLDRALEKIENELELTDEICYWLEFCRETERGLIGLQGITQLEGESQSFEEYAEFL